MTDDLQKCHKNFKEQFGYDLQRIVFVGKVLSTARIGMFRNLWYTLMRSGEDCAAACDRIGLLCPNGCRGSKFFPPVMSECLRASKRACQAGPSETEVQEWGKNAARRVGEKLQDAWRRLCLEYS